MKKLRYLLLSFYFVMLSAVCFAQNGGNDEAPQMADALRASGKIYVVVAVVVAILAGVIIYLITLDKKIGKLEKELKDSQETGVASRDSGVRSRESGVGSV